MKSESKPKISIILVDGFYRPHFAIIDSLLQQTFPQNEFEVLWVEYYDKVKPELAEKVNRHPNFRIITLGKEGVYHSSFCFNAGINEARGDLLLIIDADVLVEKEFIETIWDEHQKNEKLVMYIFRYDEPKRETPLCLNYDHLRDVCVMENPANYGGCLTVRKKWLMKINGYEQHEVFRSGGDHANGLDVYTRLKNLGLHVMWHPDLKMYHPWHPHKKGIKYGYKIQHVFINHRANSLDTLAFSGIDTRFNREVPACLNEKLEQAKKDFEKFK